MNKFNKQKYQILALILLSLGLVVYFNAYNSQSNKNTIKEEVAQKKPQLEDLPAVTAPPEREMLPTVNGNELLVKVTRHWRNWEYFRKSPIDGRKVKLPISKSAYVDRFFSTKSGLFFCYEDTESSAQDKGFYGLIGKENKLFTIENKIGRDAVQFVFDAPNDSIVIAGLDIHSKNKVLKAEIVKFNGERLSSRFLNVKLPYSIYDGQAVILNDGRLMLIGGAKNESPERKDILNNTLFIDLNTGKWSHGPKMHERRRKFTATLLPNGNVLVAGGDGKLNPGNPNFSATHDSTEILDVSKNSFVLGFNFIEEQQEHIAKWVNGFEGRYLLVAASNGPGHSGRGLQLFDVENNCWHFLSAMQEQKDHYLHSAALGSERALLGFSRFEAGKVKYITQHLILPKSCDDSPTYQYDLAKEVQLNLYNYQFIPAKNNTEANYFIGGRTDSFLPQENLNITRLIWADGRTQIFSKIINVSEPRLEELPSPNFSRTTSARNSKDTIRLKELADGRFILYGGEVYLQKVALLENSAITSGYHEKYVGIGEQQPADFYEIYNPKTNQWKVSEKSTKQAGIYAVFDDGSVLNISPPKVETIKLKPEEIKSKYQDARIIRHESMMEISNPEGTAWRSFPYKPHVAIDEESWKHTAKPFVIQNELFIAGVRVLSSDNYGFRDYSYLLEWFDARSKQWRVLWERRDPKNHMVGKYWDNLEGELIFRRLPNGKKVLLPINGVVN